MRKLHCLSLLFLFFLVACSDVKAPIYHGVPQKHLSNEWNLSVFQIGKLGPVKESWWGEDFYVLEISVENTTKQFRFFKFFDQKLDKHNLLASLRTEERFTILFKEDRNLFATDDFFKPYPGISILFSLPQEFPEPTATYENKLVFPKVNIDNKSLYRVAFLASDFGVPLKGALVESSPSSSGWLEPDEFRKFNLYFSVPGGAKLEKIVYPGILESELTAD